MREKHGYRDEFKDLKPGDLFLNEENYEYHKIVSNDPDSRVLTWAVDINMDNLRKEIIQCFNKTVVGCSGCRCHEAQQGEKDLRRHLVNLMRMYDVEDNNFNDLSHIEIAKI